MGGSDKAVGVFFGPPRGLPDGLRLHEVQRGRSGPDRTSVREDALKAEEEKKQGPML
jgi:hypothetical protein